MSWFAKVRARRSVALLLMLLFALGVADAAMAQQPSAILGQVRDESGGVLPGVTVEVSSSALQVKEVTDVTNSQGEYRITPLPIGTYTVSYSLEKVAEGTRVALTQDKNPTVEAAAHSEENWMLMLKGLRSVVEGTLVDD